jgi:hypothetical protein
MTPERRRRLRLRCRNKPRVQRKKMTRDELINYLRVNKIKTSRDLEQKRKHRDPNTYDFRKEFGNWQDALDAAFGTDKVIFSLERDMDDPAYMIDVVIMFDLWTAKAYEKARRRFPDLIPSFSRVKKQWGRFSNLKICAQARSTKKTFAAYLKLSKKLKHWPTKAECEEAGISITKLLEFFGSRKELQEFAEMAGDSFERLLDEIKTSKNAT